MTIWFDADSGQLRLTREVRDALVGWDPTDRPMSQAEQELHDAGLTVHGRLTHHTSSGLCTQYENQP